MKLTWTLTAISLAVFAYEFFLSTQGLLGNFFNTFGFSLVNILELKIWTFLTSIFVHADAEHLIFNMVALFFFGGIVEQELGWKKYLLVFFSAAVIGDIAILLLSSVGVVSAIIPTVGASAAIFGLLGIAIFLKPLEFVFYPYVIPIPLILVALLYTLYNVFAFVVVLITGEASQIAYAAHIAGLATGLWFGYKVVTRGRRLLVLILALVLLILIPFFWNFIVYLEMSNYMNFLSQVFK